jgi:hypothetical protein
MGLRNGFFVADQDHPVFLHQLGEVSILLAVEQSFESDFLFKKLQPCTLAGFDVTTTAIKKIHISIDCDPLLKKWSFPFVAFCCTYICNWPKVT